MKKKFIPSVAALCVCAMLSATTADSVITENQLPSTSQILPAADAASAADFAVTEPVVLKINGQYLNSPYAPVIVNDTTIVPLRAVMETLGWTVEWLDETKSISITNGARKIGLQIGSYEMTLDGSSKQLAVAPSLIGNVTYVPIRAVSEALGATVGWEADNSTAAIYTGTHSSTLTIGEYRVRTSSTVSELTSVCGEPTYKTVGDGGLLWYVYSEYPSAFMAVATDGGIVCGYYTNSTLFTTTDGYSYGVPSADTAREYKLIDTDGYSIALYYDKKDGILCGVNYMLDGFVSYHDISTVLQNQARLGLDVLNSFRYAHGMPSLVWSEAAAVSCTDHAYYMAQTGELTHTGADGSSALDRYLKYNSGAQWRAWGENICAETDSIFNCMNSWMNSEYHRSIMLSDKTHAGIGFIHSPAGKYKYCTAMFLIK